MVNNRPIKFIVDTCSPVTLIPKLKFNRITEINPVLEDYRDVNNNKIKFESKTLANIEFDGKSKQLELLITTKQTHPLLGDIATLKGKFHKLFTENHTVKNVEVDIQLKEGSKLIKQKGRPIPFTCNPR